jgi:hypothetical protein
LAAGLLALGFCGLGVLVCLFCWSLDELAAGLLPIALEPGPVEAVPCPLTVTRSFTRRFPANELAMRRAVSFSLLVWTLPLSSIVLSFTLTLKLSFRSVGSLWSAFWICPCRVAESLIPTLSGADEVLDAPAVPVPAVAFEPMAPELVPDEFDVDGAVVAVPVTPPTVLGVLVDGFIVELWPAMLASPVALPLLCGALEAFSPVPEVVEGFVVEPAGPVWALGDPDAEVAGVWDAGAVFCVVAALAAWPVAEIEPVVAVDCDAIAPEPVLVPVERWLLGLELPLTSPVLGLAELEVVLEVSPPDTAAPGELGAAAAALAAPFCSELLRAVVSPLLLLPLELPVLAFTLSW